MKRGAVLGFTVLLLVLLGTAALANDRIEHSAIEITNDYEFTVENGVCSGEGTLDNPYVIEGWVIDAGYDEYGIRVHGTSRAFIIRNVEISGAAKSAVYLSYVQNAYIEDCLFEGNWAGVTLNFSKFNRVSGCTFSSNTDGIHTYFSHANQILANAFDRNDSAIWLDASNENEVVGNYVSESHMGIYLNLGSELNLIVGNALVANLHHAYTDDPNLWDDGSEGNYWDGFSGLDTDENGIWDAPYRISNDGDQDNFPLVSHPLVPSPPPAVCEP